MRTGPRRVGQYITPTARNRPVLPKNADPTVASFVDPTATIGGSQYIAIGQGSFVAPFASLSAGKMGRLLIGNGSDVQDNATIGKKCDIDSTTIPSGTVVPDRTILSKGVDQGMIVR